MTAEPASPASPPAISITSTQLRSTFMPATRAALGFLPTLRNSNPVVVRLSSHQTLPAQASAIRKPALIRRCEPNSRDRRAFPAMGRVIGGVPAARPLEFADNPADRRAAGETPDHADGHVHYDWHADPVAEVGG